VVTEWLGDGLQNHL